MKLINKKIIIELDKTFGHKDITQEINNIISESKINNGIVNISMLGSTGGITTMEYESGALKDFKLFLEKVAPANENYYHNATWGDGNGYAHLRHSIVKSNISIGIENKQLAVGTWQNIVAFNFDNRRRRRTILISIIGI